MNDKTNCNPMNCDDPRACGKKDCQSEMVIILKNNLKREVEKEINKARDKVGNNYTFSRFLFDTLRYVISLVIGITWIAGFVIAKGFWSTLFCIIPFWSWYLIVELYLAKYGL